MKLMAHVDLIVMRKTLVQLVRIGLVVLLFIVLVTGNALSGAAALCVMVPAIYSMSIMAYDEINRWESFRLCLPVEREDVIRGHYASTLIVMLVSFAFAVVIAPLLTWLASLLSGSSFGFDAVGEMVLVCAIGFAISFWIPAVNLPIVAKFGVTQASRYVPLLLACVMAFSFAALGQVLSGDGLPTVLSFLSTQTGVVVAIVAAVVLSAAVYFASMLLALKFYQAREF
ncbi:MAG: ABC-2 transporter permease [Eggerthellaceae bacterium]|nr:ABC-2 transporter permease [Eggerthellaceae bacterium]